MHGLRLLAETVPKITGQAFSRKYIMIGRLVTRWEDIVGKELAGKTYPDKIRFIKSRKPGVQTAASLDIAASSADATLLHYQKDLILERINQIFGDRWIGAIRFVPMASNEQTPRRRRHLTRKPLTMDEKEHLSGILRSVEDPELLETLRNLGMAVLQDEKS